MLRIITTVPSRLTTKLTSSSRCRMGRVIVKTRVSNQHNSKNKSRKIKTKHSKKQYICSSNKISNAMQQHLHYRHYRYAGYNIKRTKWVQSSVAFWTNFENSIASNEGRTTERSDGGRPDGLDVENGCGCMNLVEITKRM